MQDSSESVEGDLIYYLRLKKIVVETRESCSSQIWSGQ